MKKKSLAFLRNVFSHEQPSNEGFTSLTDQQQQAKSGLVTADVSDDAVIASIADSDPFRGTAGAVAVEAVRAAVATKTVVVKLTNDLSDRYVAVLPSADAVAIYTAANAVSGTDVAGSLTFDGGEKNNAPLTNSVGDGTGLSTAINAELDVTKPSYSLLSLINKIEDIVLSDGDHDALIIIDQEDDTIKVLTGVPAQISAAATAALAASTVDAAFAIDSRPTSSSEKQLGE